MGILSFILNFLMVFSHVTQFLVPAWFNPKDHSNKINHLEHEGITILAENLEVSRNQLVFDLEIINETTHRIQLNEKNLYLLGSDRPYPSNEDVEKLAQFEGQLAKIHPLSEEEAAGLFEWEIKRLKRNRVLMGVLAVSLIAFDAAMDVRDFKRPEWTPKNQFNTDLRKAITMGGLMTTDAVREGETEKMYSIADDINFLHSEIFPFEDLSPRSSYRGKVFFPITDTQFIRMIFTISDIDYVLDFRWAENKDVRSLRKSGIN